MARTEFTRKTKQAALIRSGHRCEAAGTRYGFEEGQRCNCSLTLGVQYDHNIPDQLEGANSIENCMAICLQCHKFKTRNDIRQIRKSDRQRDKHSGVVRSKQSIQSPGFPKSNKPKKAVKYRPCTLYREETT